MSKIFDIHSVSDALACKIFTGILRENNAALVSRLKRRLNLSYNTISWVLKHARALGYITNRQASPEKNTQKYSLTTNGRLRLARYTASIRKVSEQ